MVSLRIDCAPETSERILAELWERGTLGVVEGDLPGGGCRLEAFFAERFDARAWNGEWVEEEDRDWVAVSREGWQPLEVGRRFFWFRPGATIRRRRGDCDWPSIRARPAAPATMKPRSFAWWRWSAGCGPATR